MSIGPNATIGTRVKWDGSNMSDMLNGDLGTIVAANSGSWASYAIKMDVPRGRRLREFADFGGVEGHWTSSTTGDFSLAPAFKAGDKIEVTGDTGRLHHGQPAGTLGTITSATDSRVYFTTVGGTEWEYFAAPQDVRPAAAAAPETLDTFRLRFLTAAVERGAANGPTRSAQVKEALDEFARTEFLSPSPDLDTFKARVVAAALAAKAKNGWCPEPERFLRDLGLGDLLPVKKTIKVVVEVSVEAPSGSSTETWREAARQAVRDNVSSVSMRIPLTTGIRITNDLS